MRYSLFPKKLIKLSRLYYIWSSRKIHNQRSKLTQLNHMKQSLARFIEIVDKTRLPTARTQVTTHVRQVTSNTSTFGGFGKDLVCQRTLMVWGWYLRRYHHSTTEKLMVPTPKSVGALPMRWNRFMFGEKVLLISVITMNRNSSQLHFWQKNKYFIQIGTVPVRS